MHFHAPAHALGVVRLGDVEGDQALRMAGHHRLPGQVRQDKNTVVANRHDTQIRMLGRERVISDLRLGLREPTEKSRFAGIG